MPDEPPATDPAQLEHLMKLASGDEAIQGPMFRALLGAMLWAPIPAHPELADGLMIKNGDTITFSNFHDAKGRFIPLFTTERAADQHLSKLTGPMPMLAHLPAKVLFSSLNNARDTVRVYAANGASIILPPVAVADLAQGRFTESAPGTGEPEKMRLRSIRPEDFPSKLLQAIRVFCVQRQGAIAVYAFHPHDPETDEVQEQEYRIFLRLRDNPGYFYNDFSLMLGRTAPRNIETQSGVVEPDDAKGQAFLDCCTPLWPILKGE